MRRYSMSYFIGQSFKGLWRNGVMSLASLTVLVSCLIVMGSFGLLVVNINYNLNNLDDLNSIVAFVDTDDSYEMGEDAILAGNLVSSDGGSVFKGWSLDPDAAEAEYEAGGRYTINENDATYGSITLYAIWSNAPEINGYKIRYNSGGYTTSEAVPTDDNVYQVGDTVTLASSMEVRFSTIEFKGWTTKPGGNADYSASGTYTVKDTDAIGGVITLYAVWSETPSFSDYKIVYDTNGVSVTSVPTDNSTKLESIRKNIESLDNIESVDFISKEETLISEKEKYEEYADLFNTIGEGENPYPDTFVINYSDNSTVDNLEYQLSHIDGIYKIRCRSDLAESIESLKNGITIVFVWFMAILFVVSIFVILNTVKLAVYSRRNEISIMRYVGATKMFISLPFLLEGVIIGLVSSGIAYMLQVAMYKYVQKMVVSTMNMISVVPLADVSIYIILSFVLIGVITGLLGSELSMRKYLKK